MKIRATAALAATTLLLLSSRVSAVDPSDTRLLAQPAVSATQIAFIYDADLWVAARDGSQARRLTTAPGVESDPAFSPALNPSLAVIWTIISGGGFRTAIISFSP